MTHTHTPTRRAIVATLLASFVFLLVAAPASAAPREDELKQRFKDRYPQLQALKSAGTVGETYLGYVEFVEKKSDEKASALLAEENNDRRELYDLIAKKEGVSAEKVAERNAKRVFEKAKAGEYLKGADGTWKKKEAGGASKS